MTRYMTSALALTLAAGTVGPVAAENNMNPEMGTNSGVVSAEDTRQMLRTGQIIGADVYSTAYDDGWEETEYYDTVGDDWEEVGDVEDVVMSPDGKLTGVIAEVGGWLDIGDANVVIDLADLKVVGRSDDSGWSDLAFVTPLTEEQLEARQEGDSGWW